MCHLCVTFLVFQLCISGHPVNVVYIYRGAEQPRKKKGNSYREFTILYPGKKHTMDFFFLRWMIPCYGPCVLQMLMMISGPSLDIYFNKKQKKKKPERIRSIHPCITFNVFIPLNSKYFSMCVCVCVCIGV